MRRGNYARHAAIWNLGAPDRSEETTFYSNLAKKYGTRVLSLMSATGEIEKSIAEKGFSVTAVDIEPAMISEAKRRGSSRVNLCFLTGDITNLDLPERDYDLALIGTGDFHHLLSEQEMLSALSGIHNHLKKGGCLVLELLYPANKSWQSPSQRFDPPNPPEYGIKTWKLGESSYDSGTLRLHIQQEVFIEENDKIESFIHEFDLQLISHETLTGLLEDAGFKITAEYGGYDFSAWQPDAEKWIIVCLNE